MAKLGLLTGSFLLTFNGWRLATLAAASMAGIQWVYWLGFAILGLGALWATTAPGRNSLSSDTLSPPTVALIGVCVFAALIAALLTV